MSRSYWRLSFVRPRSQHIGVACQHPFSALLPEDGQCMTLTRYGWSTAGRGDHDGEFRPHERPVSENLDLLNLACAVKLGSVSAGLRPCCNSEVGFPHDWLAGHQKDDIIRHQR